jgi:hypothetical protein
VNESSFGGLLAGLRSLFPSGLVDGSGWERLLALAHRLPVQVVDRRFGFEFDLCDPDPAADFCVVPSPGSPLAEFYVRQGELAPPESAEAALGRFLAEQAHDPQAPLAVGAGGVILEYDLAGVSSRQPAPPGIFIVPLDSRDESRKRQLLGDPEHLAATLWAAAGRAPDADVLRQMQRVYRALPPTCAISQAGIMPGRDQRAVRIIIGTHATGDAAPLLERIRWPGALADAAAVCEAMAAQTKPGTALSVDVTPRGVSPRLGLEFYRPVEWHDMDPTGWGLLIDLLAERGWCLPEKAHGLKSWSRVEQVFGQGKVYRVRQTINHVKVIADRGTTTAKAYAGTIMYQAA